jgi:peptide/nickel transport system substrate-binding protein
MKRIFFIAAALATLAHIGSLAWAAESPRHGGRLVFGIASDIISLNPFHRTQSTDKFVRELTFEALLDLDDGGQPIPWLAVSWTVSPDGRTYAFRLRRGVKFHNDKELTAEDVKWSADYALDQKNAATGLTILKNVREVKAKDKYTVEFVLKEPEAGFLISLAAIDPFVVVPQGLVPTGKTNLPAFPPGTGPFVFKDYKTAREIVFTRNKNYWQKGLPYIDELVLKPAEDHQTRFISLRAGDFDIIERTPYAFVRKVLNGEEPGIKIAEAKYSGFRRLVFNVTDPHLNNAKLRRAVLYALDAREFIKGANWGFGEPSMVWGIPKVSRWYVDLPEVKRDPAKVKALLKEAGVGADFELTIVAEIGEQVENQILQQQLVTAGINAKVDYVEHGLYVNRRRNGQFMMSISGSKLVTDPSDSYPFRFGCEETKKGKGRIMNYSGYCNEEFDRLVDEAGRINDFKKRYELYAKAIRILHEDAPEAPFVFVPRFFTFRQKVRGFETDVNGRYNASTRGLLKTWVAN